MQTPTTRLIPVDFLTSSHYIFGQVKGTNRGIYGILGDNTTEALDVYDASLARVQTPENLINYTPVMWLVKNKIVVVCLNKRDFIGPISLARGGYSSMYTYPVQITTTVYELQGTVEWPGRFEFKAFMAEGVNPFIILYDAILVSTLFPKLRIERPVMLFNRSFLDTLVMLKKANPDT